MAEKSLGQKLLGTWNTKTIVAVAIGAALFGVLMVYGGIPVTTNTNLTTAMIIPVVVGALGLTAAYCGTLCTPMAANFNIVPAALLETKNKYSVIKSQIPFAICMLLIHVILLYVFAF